MAMLGGAFLLLFLCVAAWALWPSSTPQQAQRPMGGREGYTSHWREEAHPPTRPARVGLGAIAGVLTAKVVNGFSDYRMSYQRTRDSNAMSSGENDDNISPNTPQFQGRVLGIQDFGYREEPGIEPEPDIKLTKGRETAITKWKTGAPLTQSDLAALIGGRRADAMAMIVEIAAAVEAGQGEQDG